MFAAAVLAAPLTMVTLAGCGDDGDDSSGSSSSGDGGGTSLFVPRSGFWTAQSVDVDTSGCGPATASLAAGWQLNLLNLSSFYFNLEDGDERLACTLDGQQFTCDQRTLSDTNDDGDAAFVLTWESTGSFGTVDEMTLDIDETRECDGPGCSDLEDVGGFTYPCLLQYSMTLLADG